MSEKNTKNLLVDEIIKKILNTQIKKKAFPLTQEQIGSLCYVAKSILMTQPMILQLKPPINVCGDFHGQFDDLKQMFELVGYPQKGNNFLFLGDYIDRGKKSLECICLLLAYKIKYRNNFFILRGNHQCQEVNRIYGFYDQCKRRLSNTSWKVFSTCFKYLPLTATIGNRIFCVHGGLSPSLTHLSKINEIRRPAQMERQTILSDLLWSDPSQNQGWNDNIDRGIAYTFGPDVIDKFLKRYDFDLICRSHQVIEDGYEFANNRTILTIFSAPNYCGKFDNLGAVLIVQKDMKCHIKQIKSQNLELQKAKRKSTPFPKNLMGCVSKEKSRKKSVNLSPLKQVSNLSRVGTRKPTNAIKK